MADDFEILFSIYEQTTHGEHYAHQVHCPTDFGDLLDVLFQDDWSIFSDETSQNLLLFDILNWNRSLEDVLDDSELYSKQENAFTFVSSSDVWNAFAYSIKRENRYFPDHDLSNELGLLIQNKLITFRTNHNFYRARIGNFPVEKMYHLHLNLQRQEGLIQKEFHICMWQVMNLHVLLKQDLG